VFTSAHLSSPDRLPTRMYPSVSYVTALMKAADGGAGGLAPIMCGSGVKVSMPAGAAKAINASRKKGGK